MLSTAFTECTTGNEAQIRNNIKKECLPALSHLSVGRHISEVGLEVNSDPNNRR